MYTLKWTFKILTLLGFCPPAYWTSVWRKILYNLYAIFLTMSLYALESTQLLDLIFSVDNQDAFSDNLYITLVFFCDCCKTVLLLYRRVKIVKLVNSLEEEPFVPMNADESKIQMKFMEQVECNTIIYTFIINLFVVGMWIASFLTDFRKGQLKFRAWIPYDYSSSLLFTVTYVHQIVATVFATSLISACDSLFSGLLVHIYCQFELLEHRLKNVERYADYTVKLFATTVNEEFTAIISVQFLANTLALCFNHYRLSKLELGSEFIETAAYTFCLLTQIFYYCWYGNEVKLKSLKIVDTALDSTVTSLDNDTKKMFLMITMRAMEPIQFTSVHIISMNLESFITLLKTSYSAYTMLQQTK